MAIIKGSRRGSLTKPKGPLGSTKGSRRGSIKGLSIILHINTHIEGGGAITQNKDSGCSWMRRTANFNTTKVVAHCGTSDLTALWISAPVTK
jgi:hypothetical protein